MRLARHLALAALSYLLSVDGCIVPSYVHGKACKADAASALSSAFHRERQAFTSCLYALPANEKNDNHDDRSAQHRGKPKMNQDPLDAAVDAFLRGDFDRISPSAPAPHRKLSPAEVVDLSLRALRDLDNPVTCHGAAVFQRFLMPLTRGERWGDSLSKSSRVDPWKETLRGAITAHMLARRIRASEFSGLLDWETLDVSEGAFDPRRDFVGNPLVAFVNAALYFGQGIEPVLIQFQLQRVGDRWLIDTARKCQMDLFYDESENEKPQR